MAASWMGAVGETITCMSTDAQKCMYMHTYHIHLYAYRQTDRHIHVLAQGVLGHTTTYGCSALCILSHTAKHTPFGTILGGGI